MMLRFKNWLEEFDPSEQWIEIIAKHFPKYTLDGSRLEAVFEDRILTAQIDYDSKMNRPLVRIKFEWSENSGNRATLIPPGGVKKHSMDFMTNLGAVVKELKSSGYLVQYWGGGSTPKHNASYNKIMTKLGFTRYGVNWG